MIRTKGVVAADGTVLHPQGLLDASHRGAEGATPLTEAAPKVAVAGEAAGSAGHDVAAAALEKYSSWWGGYATNVGGAASAAASTMESAALAFGAVDEASAAAFTSLTTPPGTGIPV